MFFSWLKKNVLAPTVPFGADETAGTTHVALTALMSGQRLLQSFCLSGFELLK